MRRFRHLTIISLLGMIGFGMPALAQEVAPGANVDSLLAYAKSRNPEFAAMQAEADASAERVVPAGALPDPKFRTELRDITKMGEQNATLSPSRVGSTRYLLMQDIPWYGKRDLKREIAELEADGAKGRALGAWADIAGRIKVNFSQLYYLRQSERLTREILDLMTRLEKVAQVRYAGGLAAQQDVIRAQVEQTNMRNELIALESEQQYLRARLNALLSRPTTAQLAEPSQLRKLPAPAMLDFVGLEERVRAKNPQLFADESKIKSAEKTRDLTYKNRYPDFTLGVSPIQYQSAIKEWELMVELNIPLQQASRRAQERESESMLNAARARKEATANQVTAELAESLAGLEAARRTENLLTGSLIPQSELTFQAALAGYETGKVDFATLLDAQRQIRQAKQNQFKAQVDAQVRLAEIERLLGEEL
ncbi:TolC family protein [Azonexus fungiphilus]|uniref:TolC family protein n=1 Tax=Azonexus fungiphilus TaxID=146940 RepID=UPI00156AAD21|nr:TolC family protein [Azonexus fungiphilus]NHC08294.1 TolC family protein [Azonexus fungiphilus]